MSFLTDIAGIALAPYTGGSSLAYSSAWSAYEANQQREQAADAQMGFQERLSNTAVQRRMADLKAAGLNPILAAKYDASSPAGVMPVVEQSMTNAANTSLAATRQEADIKKIAQEVENLEESRWLTKSQIAQIAISIRKVYEEIANVRVNTATTSQQYYMDKILFDFYDSAEFMKIAKDMGLNPSALKGIFQAFFGKKSGGITINN